MTEIPMITVFENEGIKRKILKQIPKPKVFDSPIRPDIVRFVHTNMAKNKRQPYAVSLKAGMEVSAHSWGTGRAMARLPRVSGKGSSRSGSGAISNMARGGRMFAPTKTYRRWHRKLNKGQKRYAICSAIASTSITSLVLSRGHKIETIPELPLVISSENEKINKTKRAIELLKSLGVYNDIEKVIKSKKIRVGKGKLRNRRYVKRIGPLIIYEKNLGIKKAFKNIPGIELCSVYNLNLLKLAPGSHLGRLVIWTESAINKLNLIFLKKQPISIMTNTDLDRLINSEEIQSILKPRKFISKRKKRKNPLKNPKEMNSLNPFLKIKKEKLIKKERSKQFKSKLEIKKRKLKSKNFYKEMIKSSSSEESDEEEL